MGMKQLVLAAMAATAIAATAGGASAAIITYSDRAAWTVASGGITGSEDFEGFAIDTSFNGGSVALSSGMSIGTLVASSNPLNNIVDVLPLVASEADVNGTAGARLFNGQLGEDTVPFVIFSNAIKAFGADFRNINDNRLRSTIELYSGSTLIETIQPLIQAGGGLQFLGFVADAGEQITELRFIRVDNDVFGMDDIAIAAAVPAPATIALLGAGLVGLALRRRV